MNDVTLLASSIPPFQFGFFVNSQVTGFAPNVGINGGGNLCLGGAIGRFIQPGQIVNSGLDGEFSITLDLTGIPTPSNLVAVSAGDTWFFQGWFRDTNANGSSSNLTNALGITFN